MSKSNVIKAILAASIALTSTSLHAAPGTNRQLINKVYSQLDKNAWNQLLSVSLAPSKQPVVKEGRVEDRSKVVTCTAKKVTAGLDQWVSEAAILNPSAISVWPGALVYANRQLAEGTPTPMRVDRAPVRVRVNLPGLGSNAGITTVQNPNNLAVKAAVDDLAIKWLDGAGKSFAPPLRVFSQSEKAYSTQQIGVDMGFSAQWKSGSASGSMKVNSNNKRTAVMKMIKQVYYSAELEISGGPESYFAPNVTLTSGDISTANPPAVVTSVDYGRILIAQMVINEATTSAEAEAAMSYAAGDNSASGNVSTEIKNMAKNAQFRVIAIGGGARSGSGSVLFDGDFSGFGKAIQDNFVFSKQSPAEPIAYTVATLEGELLKMNATTTYVKHECEEFPNRSVELKSSGAFVSRFSVNYMVPTGPNGVLLPGVPFVSGNKTSPYQSGRIYIPGDAVNVSIIGENTTGLLWDPVRRPLNLRDDALTKQHNCFRLKGTTLNSSYSRCD